MPTFQILIATVGRPQLQRMLDSFLPQLTCDDQLTIVFDGKDHIPTFDFSLAKCSVKQYHETEALGYFGHGIRTKYSNILEPRDFVMHFDDDDYIVPDSLNKLRELCSDTSTLYISRITSNRATHICPTIGTTVIETGNIGTPCGVIPYELNKQGKWLPEFGGDGAFYEQISKLANVKFLDIIHYIVRPDVNGFNVPNI